MILMGMDKGNDQRTTNPAGAPVIRIDKPTEHRPDPDERTKIDADPKDALRAALRTRKRSR